MSNIVLIAAIEAEEAARSAGDVSLEDRARAAMRAVRHHWLATQEQDQFAAACEGLARLASPEERQRIDADLHRLQSLSAMEPLGLIKLWHETKATP